MRQQLLLMPAAIPAATNAQAAGGSSSTTTITPAGNRYADAPLFNTRAPRGGLAFDGTANARVTSTLTGQNITTDPFSVVITFQCPTANPSTTRGICFLSGAATSVATVSAFGMWLTVGGALVTHLRQDIPGADAVSATINDFVTNYAGKVVQFIFVRNAAGNPSLYINGVVIVPSLAAVGVGSWQQSVVSTFFTVGTIAGGNEYIGQIYSSSFYNLALSATDVEEIYFLGGAVPFRFQWGSQTALVTGDDSTFTSDTGFWSKGATATIAGGKGNLVANGDSLYRGALGVKGKAFRYSFTIDSGIVSVADGGILVAGLTAGAQTGIIIATTGSYLGFIGGVGGAVIDTVLLTRVGAVVHLPLDDGKGLIAKDLSTNALHAVITATGVSHLIATGRGTTTNDNAAVGEIGEIVSSVIGSGAAVALTTVTTTNITSISLTPGDWDLFGQVDLVANAATVPSYVYAGISLTSAIMSARPNYAFYIHEKVAPSNHPTFLVPLQRLSIAAVTTVYLVTQVAFTTNTMAAYGAIRARRVR